MKSLGNLPDPFLSEIAAQPDALRRAGRGLTLRERELDAIRGRTGRGPVVFTGMGASYNSCYVPVTLLAGRGVDATMIDAAELLHFRRSILGEDSLVVMVSQSGESAEVVRLLESVEGPRGPFVVSVTNGTENSLARGASVSLDTGAGREDGPSTKTFGATLVVLAAITEVLSGASAEPAISVTVESAVRAAAEARSILDRGRELAARATAWFGDRPAMALLGRGTARAASETGALILKEAARVPAESLEAGQFRHGPLELAGPGLAAAVIATEEATSALDLALASELLRTGAAVLVITNGAAAPEGAEVVRIPDVGRALGPALAVVPFQLLAWSLAHERGFSPNELRVASKVTTRE